MKKENKKAQAGGIPLPQPSSSELRGRQSVRTTFKLSERAIGALSALSVHLGIKQKSLFDHLLEDINLLKQIAREIESKHFVHGNRFQKTFVLSRKTLICLDKASKASDMSRDALVEYSIRRLMPLIAREKEKHEGRKVVLRELGNYLKQGERMLQRAGDLLGEDDPAYERLESALDHLFNMYGQIESFIEKGKIIEDF